MSITTLTADQEVPDICRSVFNHLVKHVPWCCMQDGKKSDNKPELITKKCTDTKY
jgi:hypothetical protein